jgi:hypothetical protein
MKLTNISITKSGVMNAWRLEITMLTPAGEMKSDQHFDDFGGFLTAVKEAATFFAVRLGRIAASEANKRLLTREVAANPERLS